MRRAMFLPIPPPPFAPAFPPFLVPVLGTPREGRRDVAIPPTRGPPRPQGLGSLGRRRRRSFGGKSIGAHGWGIELAGQTCPPRVKGAVPCAVRALCEKLAVLHRREFGKFRRLKGRH